MDKGKPRDISAQFPGAFLIHQKIKGYEVAEHTHNEHEFFMPLQGEIQIRAGEQNLELKAGPGKMIYLPPGTKHSFRSGTSSQGERLILILDTKAWKNNDGGKFPPSVLPSSQLCKEIVFHLLIQPKTKAAKALIETLIQTMSEMLEDAAGAASEIIPAHLASASRDERIQSALAVIQKNYNLPLPTQEIAKQAGLSLRNFNRLFLVEVGMTPKKVITLYRIEKAKQLLGRGKHSVTDITFEVGYNSVSQFISTFRKVTGQLPSSFFPLGGASAAAEKSRNS